MIKFLCLDNFPGVEKIRQEVTSLTFRDHVSEFDSVVYPGIAEGISEETKRNFLTVLSCLVQFEVEPTAVFARMMPAGVKAPNKVHTDVVMGKYSALLYLSRHWPKGSGTAFYNWKYDGSEGFSEDSDPSKIQSNNLDHWEQYALIPAKFGRLLIYDATMWHCALPTSGFGQTPEDARLVLTAFFNTKRSLF